MQSFKYIALFIISLLTAFLFWAVIDLFLPKTPPVFIPQTSEVRFYKINLVNLFFTSFKKPAVIKTNKTLKGVKLKAIYFDKNNSFIIVSQKNKNIFLNLNDKLNGYKLIKILPNEAIFKRNNQTYKLGFKEIKVPKNTQEIIEINKNTIEKYKKNLSLVWNQIGIIKTPQGYKITYIKPGSIFEKIGLKKGDIIMEINGMELKNDADAWRIYNNIEKYDYIEVMIKRNNRQKVLRYEMD
jgi:general secretion pathway protein C